MTIPMSLTGKHWTSFDYSKPTGGWAGLDLGKEVKVDRIVYTPRNRDNYVRPGDVYELFYCERDWQSAGTIKRLPIHWCFGIFRKMHYYFYETILVERMKEFLFMKMENNNGGKV